MNRLSHETSPYLLQHAHNPVHWFPWGPEALALAKDLQKPILVSIGYAACHWCHVMERESFENEETAAIMNEHFINIKVDREERPDLDHIYMDAVQAIAGNGGWPLNVFLTPDAKPFFGGTYFPPEKAFGRNSWTDVLLSINDAWNNRRGEIEAQSEQLISHIQKANNFSALKNIAGATEPEQLFTEENCFSIAENLLKNADVEDGGFGAAPKFPQTFSIMYLLQHAHFYKNEHALKHAELSLQKMINGGIYDQLGGGMARYSTDTQWLAPHFEKMLYDNALLVSVLCDAYQLTQNEFYAGAIRRTLGFIFAELRDPQGGYYAAIDADSEGVEGRFYVWEKKKVETLLGDDAELYCAYYDISENGNWEHSNILRIQKPLEEIAGERKLSLPEAKAIIENCNKILVKERNKRIRPITDDKILLGWNALMLTAFCRAHAVLGNEVYKTAAVELGAFIESNMKDKKGDGYFHTYKNGMAKFPAFMDDYAWYIQACIQLQEITSDQGYLLRAQAIVDHVWKYFRDEQSGYFFFTNVGQEDIVVRKIEQYDGATPSANAVMAHNLLYLAIVFDKQSWREHAVEMIRGMSGAIQKYPGSFAVWASVFQHLAKGIAELVVMGQEPDNLRRETLAKYVPNKVFQSTSEINNMSLFAGKQISGRSFIYLCRNYSCSAPVSTVEELLLQLKNYGV